MESLCFSHTFSQCYSPNFRLIHKLYLVSGKKSFIIRFEVETRRAGLIPIIQCINGTRLASFPAKMTVATELPQILVIDDEMGPRESLRMLLKPNYQVHTADNVE